MVSCTTECDINSAFYYLVGPLASALLSGIPQGSILGPILFTLFINDLPENIYSQCKIFADDTKLYGAANSRDILQNDIKCPQRWSARWQ